VAWTEPTPGDTDSAVAPEQQDRRGSPPEGFMLFRRILLVVAAPSVALLGIY